MSFEIIDLTIKTFDNINLHYRKDLVDNPKAIVLISHGLAEHCGRYDYVVKKLNSFGYSVYRYDHRGHGLSDGKRGYLEKYDVLYKDLNKLVDLVKEENPNTPLFMLGHSMGAHTLAWFGCNYKTKVNGMIFCSPLICDTFNSTDIECDSDNPFTLLPEVSSHTLTHDIDIINSYESDPLILNNITLGMYNQLSKSTSDLKQNLINFNYPCLILHGSSDSVVSYEDSEFLYKQISSTDKNIIILNSLYHRLLDEIVKDEILVKISKWIEKRLY
ncbi:alpha/beta hydrolase [Romboutsia maritimum]|uniref:Alpha/beta hydrolase n=1 Tax=Romboutsia maritimum TaxID=2020948 RepID=A0A371IT62_9FIRM|nr:alpha/beta hydrolase [Romboutsia maritimum]RDY23645.1 alpha/beta hydrolase [Romboutsia maritimum]